MKETIKDLKRKNEELRDKNIELNDRWQKCSNQNQMMKKEIQREIRRLKRFGMPLTTGVCIKKLEKLIGEN